MATSYKSKEEAQAVADSINAKFSSAIYTTKFIFPEYAIALKLPRGGHYLVDPWGRFV